MTVLVLDQSVPFDELAAAAERLGWHRDPDPLAPEPILPGEPELATWSHTDGGGRLVASFEPAVMLRSVAVTGEAAAAWADELEARSRRFRAATSSRCSEAALPTRPSAA